MKQLCSVAVAISIGVVLGARLVETQGQPPPDRPAVTVRGQTYTPRSILARNMGTEADQTTAFPPHRVIGNIYYVGTRTLSSFFIPTPDGHILINSTYERNVPTIAKSVEELGYKFADIRIVLGTHAHRDHQEGDALVREMTKARVMAMAEDVPALQAMKTASREQTIDRTLRDGDTVTLGGTTLTARLTAGHTRGCTTWTTAVEEEGRKYNVVIHCSLRAPGMLTPAIIKEFERTFKLVRSLPCDVPLGDHPAQYDMHGKYERWVPGANRPWIDAANCDLETDIQEAMFRAALEEQRGGRP